MEVLGIYANHMKYFLLFFLVLFCKCDPPVGVLGVSNNVMDSKKRGVFVNEYTTVPNPNRINDSISLTVFEAWVEKKWYHSNKENEAIVNSGYQLCVNTSERDIVGINVGWSIGIDDVKYMHPSGPNSLMGALNDLPKDTIEYLVESGGGFMGDTAGKIIGRIIFVKK
jgi:hypothetical protein